MLSKKKFSSGALRLQEAPKVRTWPIAVSYWYIQFCRCLWLKSFCCIRKTRIQIQISLISFEINYLELNTDRPQILISGIWSKRMRVKLGQELIPENSDARLNGFIRCFFFLWFFFTKPKSNTSFKFYVTCYLHTAISTVAVISLQCIKLI